MKADKLGLATIIIGYSLTYLVIISFLISTFSNGGMGTLPILITIALIHIFGTYTFSLYRKQKKFINEEISGKKFKLFWYLSLIGTVLICIVFITLYSSTVYYESNVKYRVFKFLYLLVPLLLMIPQCIYLYRTRKGAGISNSHLIKIKNKTASYSKNLVNLSDREIVIVSIVLGVIVAMIFGYLFGETYHYYKGVRVKNILKNRSYSEFNFNYLLAFSSFIIVSGICYLLLKQNKNK